MLVCVFVMCVCIHNVLAAEVLKVLANDSITLHPSKGVFICSHNWILHIMSGDCATCLEAMSAIG